MKFTTPLSSSTDESLKDETRQLLLLVGSLVTLHTFVFTNITSADKPVHILMARSRVSKSRLKSELFSIVMCIFLVFLIVTGVCSNFGGLSNEME